MDKPTLCEDMTHDLIIVFSYEHRQTSRYGYNTLAILLQIIPLKDTNKSLQSTPTYEETDKICVILKSLWHPQHN